MLPRPRLSVIIPYLNEARALPATLAALLPQAAACPGIEIIAVDGGSTDASRAILTSHPGIRVMAARRGRASQMNAGARAASGDVLVFLHADTLLPARGLAAIEDAAAVPGFVYGGFHQRFSGHDWRLRLVSALHNFRCSRTQTFYGDQTLFAARRSFEDVGSYPDQHIEDIALSQRLRARAPPAFLPLAVTTDARKFVQMGVWTSLVRVIAILLCSRFGLRLPQAFFADIR